MHFHPLASRRQRHHDEETRQHRYDAQIREDERLSALKNKAIDRYSAWRDAEQDSRIAFIKAERAAGRRVPSQGTFESRHPFVANEWLYPDEGRIPDDAGNPYENFPKTPLYERRKREWDEDRQRSRERREERRPRPPAYSREERVEMRLPAYEERESGRGTRYQGEDEDGWDDFEDEFPDPREREMGRRRTG